MRRFLAFLIMLGVMPIAGFGQSPEELFVAGNQAFQKGDYAKAVDMYESILHNGYTSSDLYYNLGNSYFKQGNFPKSILNYERALRLTPGDDDLRHNVQLANQMITDRIDPAPHLFVWDWWNATKNWFSFDAITWLLYAIYVLEMAVISLVVVGQSYRLRRIALMTGVGQGLVLLFVVAVFVARYSDAHRTDDAIVMTQVVNVKNSPDDRSSDAFVIHAGLKVQLTDHLGEWTKIKLADGKVGWMHDKEVEVI